MAKQKTYYATRPFWWAGKNIGVDDPVKMDDIDAKGMLYRGAVTENAPKKVTKKPK